MRHISFLLFILVVVFVSCHEQEPSQNLYYFFPEVDTYLLLNGTRNNYTLYLSKYLGHFQQQGISSGWNARVFAEWGTPFTLYLFEKENFYGAPFHDIEKIRVRNVHSFFFWLPQRMKDNNLPFQGVKVQFPPERDGRLLYTDMEGKEHEAICLTEELVSNADPATDYGMCYIEFPYELFPFKEESEDVQCQLNVLPDMSGFVYKRDTIWTAPLHTPDGYYEPVRFYIHPKLPEYVFYYSFYSGLNKKGDVRSNNPSCIFVLMDDDGFINVMNDESKLWRSPWITVRVEKSWRKTRFGGNAYDKTIIHSYRNEWPKNTPVLSSDEINHPKESRR